MIFEEVKCQYKYIEVIQTENKKTKTYIALNKLKDNLVAFKSMSTCSKTESQQELPGQIKIH